MGRNAPSVGVRSERATCAFSLPHTIRRGVNDPVTFTLLSFQGFAHNLFAVAYAVDRRCIEPASAIVHGLFNRTDREGVIVLALPDTAADGLGSQRFVITSIMKICGGTVNDHPLAYRLQPKRD